MEERQEWLSPVQYAERYGLHSESVRRMCRAGDIVNVRHVGSKWRILDAVPASYVPAPAPVATESALVRPEPSIPPTAASIIGAIAALEEENVRLRAHCESADAKLRAIRDEIDAILSETPLPADETPSDPADGSVFADDSGAECIRSRPLPGEG